MKELLEIFGNIPVTVGMIVVFISLGGALVNSTIRIFKIYSKINRKIDTLEAASSGILIGEMNQKLTKIENDLNSIARKSRNSDRVLLQHINSHCNQLGHMASYLQAKGDYHPPTKMNLPEDMI